MVRYPGLLFLFLLVVTSLQAQSLSCDCAANLRQLIQKTEENYAGFPNRVTARTRSGYFNLVKELQSKAPSLRDPVACFTLMESYIAFFADWNLQLTYLQTDPRRKIIAMPQEMYFNSVSPDRMEGIWRDADSAFVIGIRNEGPGKYKALVIYSADPQWESGQLYANLYMKEGQWVAREHGVYTTSAPTVVLRENLLQIGDAIMLARVGATPLSQAQQQVWLAWQGGQQGLILHRESARTLYLRLPRFRNNEEQIRDLLQQQDAQIRSTEHLVIDLRGNTGGGDAWRYVLPYIQSGPLPSLSMALRVNPQSIVIAKAALRSWIDREMAEGKQYGLNERRIAQYREALVQLDTTTRSFYTLLLPLIDKAQPSRNPKKVTVLFDEGCAGSCELFLLLCKSSGKVVLNGEHSRGSIEYPMPLEIPLSCPGFTVTIPLVTLEGVNKPVPAMKRNPVPSPVKKSPEKK